MKIHIIATSYNRPVELQRLIYDFQLQTNPNWNLHIIHDGPILKKVVKFIHELKDPRIKIIVTPKVNGYWGHPNRKRMLKEIKGEPGDYVLITNDDNQYIKIFIESFLDECGSNVGMVYCNTIHNYINYEILDTKIKTGCIDMGSFIVRLDIAQTVGFKHTVEIADGMYAEECGAECKRKKMKIIGINKALFIHN